MKEDNSNTFDHNQGKIRSLQLQHRISIALLVVASVAYFTVYFSTDLLVQAPTVVYVALIAITFCLIAWARNRKSALDRCR